MKHFRLAALGAVVVSLVASGLGCELIAQVDRSKIDGNGGGGGVGGQSPTTSTTSSTTSSVSSGSTGGGGAGSTSSTGGTGGAGGGMPCTVLTDCPAPASECIDRTCDTGTCGEKPKDAGTAATAQTAGDCKKSQCDGAGKIVDVNDDTDLPDDSNDCTDEACTAGVASHPSKAINVACGLNGALKCNGAGLCVGCIVAADCSGQDTECQARSCTAGACGVVNTAKGTIINAQTAGDCKASQCDGNGATEIVDDNADVPVDSETCTKDLCTAGVPSNPSEPASTACAEGGGTQCDGAGKCVACLVANDCPGQDTECLKRACNAGVCGTMPTSLGTALASQTANDCQKAVCDGVGGTTTQADDTDLPNDNNACTTDVCTAGLPSNPSASNGTVCGVGLTCLNGACAGCAAPSDCPGVDDECKSRTCTVGVCGFAFTANGTAVAAQIAGNCQKNQCDGTGNITSVADNTDVPADDGNQCTSDVCVAGAPSHPAQPTNTACSQNGGSFCSAAGDCVACNAPAQCPGTDTDCQARSCTGNACGFTFQPSGTVTSTQTAGDCQVNQCDGAGNVVQASANADVPADDGNQCTSEICTAGVASHPAKAVDTACSQNGGTFCSAAGACVECNAPTQCSGTDTECHARTCNSNACGQSNTAAGTATSSQTAGDCQKNQCDGAGNIVTAADDTDAPADDGNQCTSDVCVAGVASHPAKAVDTACNQNGGTFCSAASTCVECNAPTQCSGSDTECHTRTCNSNACGQSNTAAGTATSAQTSGDCQQNQCDGAGNIVSAASDADVPNDSNQCTSDVCTAGVPSNPNASFGTACNQSGGTLCNGSGACVAPSCSDGAQNGTETDVDCGGAACQACVANAGCSANSDCQSFICAGNICALESCTDGVKNGTETGIDCGGATCSACPAVASTTAADGATNVGVSSTIAVTFNAAMSPATLTAQTTSGACSGSVQVSTDGFATCIGITSPLAFSGGNTVVTLTPAPGLSFGSTYKIKVTTAAQDPKGNAVAAYTSTTGFTTVAPGAQCLAGTVVISQVYGGGGNTGAQYKNDFVELHNRGTTTVNLAGMSLQYTSSTGTVWNSGGAGIALLSGSIPPGGYFLVQLATGGAVGASLTPDLTPAVALALAAANGKIALINSTTQIANGTCPPAATTVDFVGYGSADCKEGASAVAVLSNTTAALRAQSGCADVNNNGADFSVVAPAPRNAATAVVACACGDQTLNESGPPAVTAEADYCVVQFPTSLSVQAGTDTGLIYGRIFESGVTDPAGAPAGYVAQVGYGSDTSNPETQAGWTWFSTTYNTQVGNDDEFQGSFTAPATAGKYRYAYRFSADGVSWTYCDANGAGSTGVLSFETTQLPILTVTP